MFQVVIKTTQIEDGRLGSKERGTGLSDAAESVGGNLLASRWICRWDGTSLQSSHQVGGQLVKMHHIVRRPLKEAFLASKIVILAEN